jgi:hypothetical protein
MTTIETAAIHEERRKQEQTSSPPMSAKNPGQSLSRHIAAGHRAPLFFHSRLFASICGQTLIGVLT